MASYQSGLQESFCRGISSSEGETVMKGDFTPPPELALWSTGPRHASQNGVRLPSNQRAVSVTRMNSLAFYLIEREYAALIGYDTALLSKAKSPRPLHK